MRRGGQSLDYTGWRWLNDDETLPKVMHLLSKNKLTRYADDGIKLVSEMHPRAIVSDLPVMIGVIVDQTDCSKSAVEPLIGLVFFCHY